MTGPEVALTENSRGVGLPAPRAGRQLSVDEHAHVGFGEILVRNIVGEVHRYRVADTDRGTGDGEHGNRDAFSRLAGRT